MLKKYVTKVSAILNIFILNIILLLTALNPTLASPANELQIFQVINSAAITSTFTYGMADDSLTQAYGFYGGSLAAAGLSLYGTNFYINNANPKTAQVQYINSMSFWGLAQGYLIGDLFFGDKRNYLIASMLDASLMAYAFESHGRYDLHSGRIALINSGGLWGAYFGFSLNYVLGTGNANGGLEKSLLIGSLLGMAAVAIAKNNGDYTRSEVANKDLNGVYGALIGVGFSTMFILLSNMRNWDDIIVFSMAAGAALGLGLSYLKPGSGGDEQSTKGSLTKGIYLPFEFARSKF